MSMPPVDFPLSIQIQTTSRCNAHCIFCPYPEASRRLPQGNMDDGLFRSIVDEISLYPVHLLQPFLMNEPLVDKKILQRLEYLIEKNPNTTVCLTTNGKALNPELALQLARLNLDTIHISSNGLSRDCVRKTMGIDSYAVLKNINDLWDCIRKENSGTRLVVTTLFQKANKEEIFLMKDYWQSRGITFYMNPLNDRAGNINTKDFMEMLPFDSQTNRDHLLFYPMKGCPDPLYFMGILYNGDVVICCMDWYRTTIVGNAKENTLYDIWHGEAYAAIRQLNREGKFRQLKLCGNCGNRRFSMDQQLLLRSHQDHKIINQLLETHREHPEIAKMNLIRPSVVNDRS